MRLCPIAGWPAATAAATHSEVEEAWQSPSSVELSSWHRVFGSDHAYTGTPPAIASISHSSRFAMIVLSTAGHFTVEDSLPTCVR